MEMTYELWDVDAANTIGTFPSEEEAIGVVTTLLDAYGPGYANDLSLSLRAGNNQARVVAAGKQLIAMTSARPARLN